MIPLLQNMTGWRRWAGVAALAAVALQMTNPPHTNPNVLPGNDLFAANPPPAEIRMMIRNACYDCHSFETKWPWYSYVAPASWLVARDIEDGRNAMNFSEWPHDQPSRARKRWRHIAEVVEDQQMPLRQYLWMHPEGRLTAQESARLVQWARRAANMDAALFPAPQQSAGAADGGQGDR